MKHKLVPILLAVLAAPFAVRSWVLAFGPPLALEQQTMIYARWAFHHGDRAYRDFHTSLAPLLFAWQFLGGTSELFARASGLVATAVAGAVLGHALASEPSRPRRRQRAWAIAGLFVASALPLPATLRVPAALSLVSVAFQYRGHREKVRRLLVVSGGASFAAALCAPAFAVVTILQICALHMYRHTAAFPFRRAAGLAAAGAAVTSLITLVFAADTIDPGGLAQVALVPRPDTPTTAVEADLGAAAAFVDAHTSTADRIQVFGGNPSLLVRAQRMSATPVIDDAELVPVSIELPDDIRRERLARRDEAERAMRAKLEARPPRAIVFVEGEPSIAECCAETQSWVEEHYAAAIRFGKIGVRLHL